MRFSVFALCTVPDTDTARQMFDLANLDDKSVAKVLAHHRKQQTGASEVLRWDQRAIASLSLIQHSTDNVKMASMSLETHTEPQMLEALFDAALHGDRLISWDGLQSGLPLAHFRALKHRLSHPAYWQAYRARRDLHLDLRRFLAPVGDDLPELGEFARALGFPGMLQRAEATAVAGWLQGRYDTALAVSDLAALNTYLIAQCLLGITGDISQDDDRHLQARLRGRLASGDEPHLAEFLTAWRSL